MPDQDTSSSLVVKQDTSTPHTSSERGCGQFSTPVDFGPSTIAQLDKGEGGQFIAPGERWETVDWCVVSLDTVGPSQDVRWTFHVSGGLEAAD